MAKRKQIGILGAAAIAAATMLGGANQVNALPVTSATVSTQQTKKDAVPVEKKQVRPESKRNKHGGFSGIQNPYKHIRVDERNQRQWRKWLRSNPHMRKSKKSKQ